MEPHEVSRHVAKYFTVVSSAKLGMVTIAFRGETDQANAGTVGIRELTPDECEVMANELRWSAIEARHYADSFGRTPE